MADKQVILVDFADGTSETFHIAWLRDSCKCSKCLHPTTFQKLLSPATINLDYLAPIEIKNDGKNLTIKWKDDDSNNYHQSDYLLQWLAKFKGKFRDFTWSTKDYPEDGIYQPFEVLEAVHWNVDTIKKVNIIKDFNDIMESDKHLKEFLRKLCTLGIALVKNAGSEEGTVLKLARRIAYERSSGKYV